MRCCVVGYSDNGLTKVANYSHLASFVGSCQVACNRCFVEHINTANLLCYSLECAECNSFK